jgi:hypothetical protein
VSRFEDLYEMAPTEAELVGGSSDGRRIVIADGQRELLVPSPTMINDYWAETGPRDATINCQRYRRAGIRDDGTREFRLA